MLLSLYFSEDKTFLGLKRLGLILLLFVGGASSALAQEAVFAERMGFPAGLEARITYSREDIVFLDQTSENGVRPGMVFDVYAGGSVVRNDSGNPVATTGSRRGSLLILRSNSYHSVGRVIEGTPSQIWEGHRAFLITVPEINPVAVLPLSDEASSEDWMEEFDRLFRERLMASTEIPLAPEEQVLRRLDEEFPDWRGVPLTPELAREYGRLLATDRLVEITEREDGRVVARLWDALGGRVLAEAESLPRAVSFAIPAAARYSDVSSGRYRLRLTLRDLPAEVLDAAGEKDETYRVMYFDRAVRYRVDGEAVTVLESQIYPVDEIQSAHGKWMPFPDGDVGFVQLNGDVFRITPQDVEPLNSDRFVFAEDLTASWSEQRNVYENRGLSSEGFVDLAVADLDGDGSGEIVLLTQDGRLVILNEQHERLQRSEAGEYQGCLAAGDLNRDGRDEVYVSSDVPQGFRVYVLEWSEARNEAVRRFGSGILSGTAVSLSTVEPDDEMNGRLVIGRRERLSSVIDVYEVYPE